MLYTIRCILLLAVLPIQLYGSAQLVGTLLADYPSEYPGLAQEIADLPIYCLHNSRLARTTRVKVFTAEDGSRQTTVQADKNPLLDSTMLQDPPLTVGQLLNAMPHDIVKPVSTSSQYYFWRNFGLHCGIPLAFLSAVTLFSKYVKNIDLEKLAIFTASVSGTLSICSSFWSLYEGTSCSVRSITLDIQKRYLREWLTDHARHAGLYKYLSRHCALIQQSSPNAPNQYDLPETHSLGLGQRLDGFLQALNDNERHVYRAHCAIETLYAQEKQLFCYPYKHIRMSAGRFFGGGSAAVLALLLAGYVSKP